jgi:hypothetical protein
MKTGEVRPSAAPIVFLHPLAKSFTFQFSLPLSLGKLAATLGMGLATPSRTADAESSRLTSA